MSKDASLCSQNEAARHQAARPSSMLANFEVPHPTLQSLSAESLQLIPVMPASRGLASPMAANFAQLSPENDAIQEESGERGVAVPKGLDASQHSQEAAITVPDVVPQATADQTVLQSCRTFVATRFQGHLRHTPSGFLVYQSGCWWRVDVDACLKPALLEFIGDTANVTDIDTMIKMLRISQVSSVNPFDNVSHLICLRNGTLDPLTRTLRQHSPDDHLSSTRNVEWNPDATCPRWLQALDEIFGSDSDRAEKIELLQEFIGYCLIPDRSMHKFLWMVGGGANGKSVVLKVMTDVVGSANVHHAELSRLASKFARAELVGKLLNISAEMPSTISDNYLKQITSGDRTEAERKYQPSFSFKPTARLVGATNALPRLRDFSEGFRRRAIILTFNRKFTEAEQDGQLGDKLLEELPGILVWAVAGLQRLKARGRFVMPARAC